MAEGAKGAGGSIDAVVPLCTQKRTSLATADTARGGVGIAGFGSLAWAGKETAGAADVGVARLLAVWISALVIDHH